MTPCWRQDVGLGFDSVCGTVDARSVVPVGRSVLVEVPLSSDEYSDAQELWRVVSRWT